MIQIKPQLEKVLNLSPDSLTEEIQQQVQDPEYQIATDLMSFEDPHWHRRERPQ